MGIDRIVALVCRRRLDPRRDRLPEDRQRRRPADRRSGAGRRAPAAGSGAASRSSSRRPRSRSRARGAQAIGPQRPMGWAMAQISPPFRIALVAIALLGAVWFVALRPKAGHRLRRAASGGARRHGPRRTPRRRPRRRAKAADASAARAEAAAAAAADGTAPPRRRPPSRRRQSGATVEKSDLGRQDAVRRRRRDEVDEGHARQAAREPVTPANPAAPLVAALDAAARSSSSSSATPRPTARRWRRWCARSASARKVVARVVSIKDVGKYQTFTAATPVAQAPTTMVIGPKRNADGHRRLHEPGRDRPGRGGRAPRRQASPAGALTLLHSGAMPDERFEDHLRHPRGRGHVPAGSHMATAGAPRAATSCASTSRSRATASTDAGFDAEGCGATIAAASAAVELVRGAHVLDAARIGVDEIAAELGGLSLGKRHAADLAADALARALGHGRRAPTRALAPAPGRTLVAMSRRRRQRRRRAALRARRRRRAGRRHAQALARRRERRASARAARRRRCAAPARSRTAWASPHLTLDLREAFRAGVVRPVPRRPRRGADAEPVRALQRQRAARRDARPRRARSAPRALATGHYARVSDDGPAAAPRPTRPRTRATCSPALRPGELARLRFPLGELTKPEVRDARRARGPAGRRASPIARTSASSPAPAASAFLARHGGPRERPGRDRRPRRPRARPPPRRTPLHRRPAPRPRRRGGTEPLYVARHRRGAPTRSPSARARRCDARACRGRATRRCTAPARRVDARRSCATARAAAAGRRRAAAATALDARAASRVGGAAPGPDGGACCGGDVVVGHGDDRRACPGHDLGRDPRDLPRRSSSSATTGACPRRRSCPPTHDPSVLLTTAGHAAVQALLPRPGDAARAAPDDLPEVLPHDRHRGGRQHRAPPHLLRDARQLLDRRLLQGGRGRATPGSSRSSGFGFDPEEIWITVFDGDDELGLGPDEEAIEVWEAVGVPRERIVLCPRSENFWQAGPDRARAARARSCTSTAASSSARPTTCPATTTSASSSTGTSSSCSTTRTRTGTLDAAAAPRTSTPAWASTGWR